MPPFDTTKITYQLGRALTFITTYTRDTFPLFLSSRYLAPNSFHDSPGRQNYFPSTCGTSEALTVIGVAAFKAFEATGNTTWRALGTNIAESYRSYFHLDDLFTTVPNGLNTPLVRNHWLGVVRNNANGTAQKTEGITDGSVVSDPFNFGYFGSATFTSGTANLNSDLSRVFKVHNGELLYKNVYAPLKSGSEYLIDYWVSDGYRNYPNGNKTVTGEANGLVKLVSTFSGSLFVVYSRFTGSNISPPGATALQGEHFLEPYPIWFKTKQASLTYTGAAFDAYWWAYDLYTLAYKHNPSLTKYQNAAEVLKWNTLKYADTSEASYFYKRSPSSEPLSYAGSYLLQYAVNASGVPQTLPGYTASRETALSDRLQYLKLNINANEFVNVFSGVELQNYVTNVYFDPLVEVKLQVCSSVTNLLEVRLSTSKNVLDFSQDYYAYWLVEANLVSERTFKYSEFLRFDSDNVWHPRIVEVPSFTYNGATTFFARSLIDGVACVTFLAVIPNNTAGVGFLGAKYTNKLPKIRYGLVGAGRFRFKDAFGNFYYLNVSDTSDNWLTFDSSWQESFGVDDRLLTEIVFENTQSTETRLFVYWIGAPGKPLPVPITTYKAAVIDRSRAAHTLWIGDFQALNNSLDKLKYTPGAIPFTINTLNGELQGFRGKQFYMAYQSPYSLMRWGYPEYAKNVVKMFSDAQDSYTRQSTNKIEGLLHQVFLPYGNENAAYLDKIPTAELVLSFPVPFIFDQIQLTPSDAWDFNQFSWKGLDPNTQWSPYQFRALEDLSKYYLLNQGDITARKVLENYIKYAYQWITTNPTQQITNVIPEGDPQSLYYEPHAAAIEGITAININRAGIQRGLSWAVIQNKFDYIDNQFVDTGTMAGSWCKNQPTFTFSSQTYQEDFTFWKGKIIEFYSLALLHKDELFQDIGVNVYEFPALTFADGSYRCDNIAHFIIEIEDDKYPIITQEYADRTQQRILRNRNPKNKIITFRYEKLNSAQTKQITDFYALVNRTANGVFTFNTATLPYTDFTGKFIFKEAPKIDVIIANSARGLFNVEITVRRVG